MNSPTPARHTRTLTAGSLSLEERADLTRALYPVFCESMSGVDERTFADTVLFRGADSRIALFHSDDGELAGFASACVMQLTAGGAEHAVFNAGVLMRRGFRGGDAAARFGLVEALRHRLRHPRGRLWYVCQTTSPAPYMLFARTVPTFYPNPHEPTPPDVEELFGAYRAALELSPVEGSPHLTRQPQCACRTRLPKPRAAATDRYASYYLRENPRFDAGVRLLVCIPLDWSNIAAGLFAPLARLFRFGRANRPVVVATEPLRIGAP